LIPVKPSSAGKPDPANKPYIYATDDAGLAAEMMGRYNTDTLLVIDSEVGGKPIGIITARSILHFYSRQRQKDQTFDSPGRTRRMLVRGRKFWRNYKN
jgi:hypothetical protein